MRQRTDADVLHPVYAVLERLRWALVAHAVVVNLVRVNRVHRPGWLVVACLAMVGWTWWVGRRQQLRANRTWPVMLADVTVTVALLSASRWILGREALVATYLPVTVYWMAASPLVVSVWRGGLSGLLVAGLLSLVKFVQEPRPDPRVWGSMVALGLCAWGLGAVVDTLRESVAAREREQAHTAALAERDRLNRIVHDGALQVLALVEREGPELGTRGEHLARLARQQEVLLRGMLSPRGHAVPGPVRRDLAATLEALADDRVTVSVATDEVWMSPLRVAEVEAAVGEALVNVARHAGPHARAWVLLEAEDDRVLVSVRDNGVGMCPEQLVEAVAAGRMGVNDSIRGRIRDLGGHASVRSAPDRGVEWEFSVPRHDPNSPDTEDV